MSRRLLVAALMATTLAVASAPPEVRLLVPPAAAQEAKTPLYYQDPDGKPDYSPVPKKTADGRDYVAVFEDTSAPATTPSQPAGKEPGQGRILYYRNPMGLPDTSPVPKKDSMGMDYIPLYKSEAEAGVVTVAPGRLQLLGVRSAPVEKRPAVSRTVRATGTLSFDERRLAVVTTKVEGWIEQLDVAATGEAVRKGQVLAWLYSPLLVTAEEEYLLAARMPMTHGGGSVGAAALQRLRSLDVPEDEIARLHRSGKATRRIAIRAPGDGIVTDKPVIEGMRVMPGEPLYKLADLSSIWLIADVQEGDLRLIRRGANAHASMVAFPGRTFDGTVDFIYPTLASDTRTARVRIVMPNPELALRAAMYASVEIAAPASDRAVLTVPDSAVIDSGARQVVLIEKGEGRFAPRVVRVGARGGGFVEILEGVADGERVVVGANFLIDAESNLKAALEGFAAGSPQGGAK
jgi:Cu(I)/Ag(I) efflux system membrane fusion protein